MKKSFIKIVVSLFIGLFALAGIWWIWPEHTPPIKGTNAVSSLEYIGLGGVF
ncbi:MAG: hypothetical protein KDC79_08630 [Cyclobacteriaceae bacterium]|nr:hypothetical protein [Cyclobacteriaceae bacterium]